MSATTQQTWTLDVPGQPEIWPNLDIDSAKAAFRSLLASSTIPNESITGDDWPLDWEDWRDNGCCPHCGVYGIDGDNLGVHGLAIEQAFTCPLCDYSWQDNYELVSHNDDTKLYPVKEERDARTFGFIVVTLPSHQQSGKVYDNHKEANENCDSNQIVVQLGPDSIFNEYLKNLEVSN